MKKLFFGLFFLLVSAISFGQQDGNVANQYLNKQLNALFFAIKGDAATAADMVVNGTTTATSASITFTNTDIGKSIIIWGVGSAGADLRTTIISINSAHSIVIGVASTASGSSKTFYYGTDNTNQFRTAAINCQATGTRLILPAAKYIINGNINFPNPVYIYGDISGPWILAADSSGSGKLPNTQIINLSATEYSFSLQASNSFVQNVDFLFAGSSAATGGGGVKANGSQTSFEGCSFFNEYNGIAETQSINWHASGNTFKCTNYGIYIQNLTNADFGDYSIFNNYIQNSSFGVGGVAGVRIESSGGLKLFSNKFNGPPGLVSCISINLVGAANSTSDWEISNNSFENYSSIGIELNTSSSALAYGLTIIGNQFYTNSAAVKAIKINGGAATSIWGGNIADNNFRFPSHTDTAIWLKNCTDLIVSNNIMFQGNFPLYVDATCLRITQDNAVMSVATGAFKLNVPTTFDLIVNGNQGMHQFSNGHVAFGIASDFGDPLQLAASTNGANEFLVTNGSNGNAAASDIALGANNNTANSFIQQRGSAYATFPEYLNIQNFSPTNKIIGLTGTNVGISTALFTPTGTLDVYTPGGNNSVLTRSGATANQALFGAYNSLGNGIQMFTTGSTQAPFGLYLANYSVFQGNSTAGLVIQNVGSSVAPILFGVNIGGTPTEVARLNTAGHLLLNTTTDNGQLTVAGVVAPEAAATRDLGTSSFYWRNLYTQHLIASATSVTFGAGSLGTGPVNACSGSDASGIIDFTTGTGPSANATMMTVTFGAGGYSFPTGCRVTLTPANGNAAALTGATQVYIGSTATTNWTLKAGSSALAASTQYQWYYHVIGF